VSFGNKSSFLIIFISLEEENGGASSAARARGMLEVTFMT
jgi:hypothetical protein